MQQCTSASGMHLHMNSSPTEIIKGADGKLTVKLTTKSPPPSNDKQALAGSTNNDAAAASESPAEISGNDVVVLAVGRAGKIKGLGLEEVGVAMGPKGSIKVDEFSRTNIPSIWGVGDVTSRIALTPVAIMEGQAVGQSIATGQLVAPQYDAVPSACFSWPFVATVVSLCGGCVGRGGGWVGGERSCNAAFFLGFGSHKSHRAEQGWEMMLSRQVTCAHR